MTQEFLLALNQVETLNAQHIAQIEHYWPRADDFFKQSSASLIALGFSQAQVKGIKSIKQSAVDEALAWQSLPSRTIIDWHHPHYPKLLKETPMPPPILFAEGKLDCLNQQSIAIVGTRKPTISGVNNAKRFSQELSDNGLVIVSGLALGIDGIAHQACLDSNGTTIAVLPAGIDKPYPRRHQKMADKIKENGLILSEFSLKTPPLPRQFPRRNRIISGLSLGTLIIEAAIKSGTLITARCAIEQNREVFAIPGAINNPLASGCNYLLQQGATLITKSEEILSHLSLTWQQNQEAPKNLTQGLEKSTQKLVSSVGFEVTSFDDIVKSSGLDASQLMSELIELELHGVIKSVPGGYMRC